MTLSKDSINERVKSRVDELFSEFCTNCPYGRKAVSACPALGKDGRTPSALPANYIKQFFTECPHGKRAQAQCPYGRKLVAHQDDHHHSEYAKEFFTECPYGRRATSECPYGRDILAKSKSNHHHHHEHDQTKYVDEFFTQCPYGRRAAEQCPYGHDLLEKANIEVSPLQTKSDAKCPFASLASEGETRCPIVHGGPKEAAHGKCPVGSVMPQSENCPFSPNYKNRSSVNVDLYESDTEFKFYVELPGTAKGDVKLEVKDNIMTLSSEKKDAPEGYARRIVERQLGLCSRTISLPDNASVDKIQADMEDGLLTITVPKGTPSIAKSININ